MFGRSNLGSVTDGRFWWRFRFFHELADGVENKGELAVVFGDFALQGFELGRQLMVGRQKFPQFHKGSHNKDAGLGGAGAPEHVGGHHDAMFGKRGGPVFDVGSAL